MTHEAILCMGSNIELRRQALDDAIKRIDSIADIQAVSDFILSPDITRKGDDYLNVAIRCLTDIELEELTKTISHFETLGGRTPLSKAKGVMPIDIDIIIWDGKIISEAEYRRPYVGQTLATL